MHECCVCFQPGSISVPLHGGSHAKLLHVCDDSMVAMLLHVVHPWTWQHSPHSTGNGVCLLKVQIPKMEMQRVGAATF